MILPLRRDRLETEPLARKIVDIAVDQLAGDILMLDIREISSFADFFVLCTGESARQIKTIAERIDELLGREGVSLRRQEGDADSGWVLLDFGDVVAHIFAPEERAFYQLEELWSKGKPLVRIQ